MSPKGVILRLMFLLVLGSTLAGIFMWCYLPTDRCELILHLGNSFYEVPAINIWFASGMGIIGNTTMVCLAIAIMRDNKRGGK